MRNVFEGEVEKSAKESTVPDATVTPGPKAMFAKCVRQMRAMFDKDAVEAKKAFDARDTSNPLTPDPKVWKKHTKSMKKRDK